MLSIRFTIYCFLCERISYNLHRSITYFDASVAKKIQKKLLNSFYSIIMQHIVRNTIVQCQPCIFFSSLHFYFQILYRHEIIPHWLQHFCFFICSFFRILDLMSKDSQEILLTILLYYPWVFEPIFIGFWLVSCYQYYAMIGPYLIQYLAKKQHLH